MAGPVHGIDEEDVLPAVVVVVEKTDAATHCFGEIFFAERAAVMLKVNAGLRSDVGELDGARGAGDRCERVTGRRY